MKVLDSLPRLAIGSHPDRNDPRKCAMNWVSLANGDTCITDTPDCAHPLLANAVISVNDSLCTHRDGDWLCGDCSTRVLELAVRTIGTNSPPTLERFKTVDVPLAAWAARRVLHLVRSTDRQVCLDAIEAAEGWCAGTTTDDQVRSAADAAANANAYANAEAAAANANAEARYQFVSDLIDEYDRLTGRRWHEPAADLRCTVLTSKELVNA